MTLPSSVQRYYNSCVIPKSYEQKKDVTVQSRPLIVFFYLCLIYNSSLFFTYIHIGESRISFLTFSLLSRFLPFAYTISRRIARSKTRCQRTKSQAINFVCYTCSRLICFRFIHILKFIYFHNKKAVNPFLLDLPVYNYISKCIRLTLKRAGKVSPPCMLFPLRPSKEAHCHPEQLFYGTSLLYDEEKKSPVLSFL